MKKTILFFAFFFLVNPSFCQFLSTGTLTDDNKFRSGGIGIGYSTLPTTFGANKLMVNGNSSFSGNVGLGTLSPISQLHMPNGVLSIGNPIPQPSTYGINSNKGIVVESLNSTNMSDIMVKYGVSNVQMAVANCAFCYSNFSNIGDSVLRGNSKGSFIIANENNGSIKFETGQYNVNTKVQMMINNLGNISIGSGSNPIAADDKLAVNGLIHSKEVKVDLIGWPDFVFEDNYKLPTLLEVENQIKTNGHLSNIPPAIDIETNGLLLGEMNKKLLQKIEELTLYIIDMNKDIELLKTRINK